MFGGLEALLHAMSVRTTRPASRRGHPAASGQISSSDLRGHLWSPLFAALPAGRSQAGLWMRFWPMTTLTPEQGR